MRKNLLLVASFLVMLAAGVSCNKEMPGAAGNEEIAAQAGNGGLCTVTFRLNPQLTKALTYGGEGNDSAINRIDVFRYQKGNSSVPDHFRFTADELSSMSFHDQMEKNSSSFYYLFYANLNDDIVNHAKTLTALNMRGVYYKLSSFLGLNSIPMAGGATASFSKDQTIDVDLYRYMYRVDLGKIEVDFDDESRMNKDVFVKTIAIINIPNVISLNRAWYSGGAFNIPAIFLGYSGSLYMGFGGLTQGYQGESLDSNDLYTLKDAENNVLGSYYKMYNWNVQKDKGVFILDGDTSLMQNITTQTYDISNGEGRVCSSTNPSQSHVLTVNKSFLALAGGTYGGNMNMISDYYEQNTNPKLVIELSVDGTSYYYPMLMSCTQPNTVYKLDKVTIKSQGSPYSNFFVKNYSMDASLSVHDWDEVTISNIDTGYTDDTGTAIY